MNTLELIKDAAFFGGNIPNERLKECRDFFDNVIEKQLRIGAVGNRRGTLESFVDNWNASDVKDEVIFERDINTHLKGEAL